MKRVVVGVNDLMLAPRFLDAAKRLGYEAKKAGSPESVLDACAGVERALVLVDLHDARLRPEELFPRLRALAHVTSVGFHGHMVPELGEKARAAGCTKTFSRGQLLGALDDLVREALA